MIEFIHFDDVLFVAIIALEGQVLTKVWWALKFIELTQSIDIIVAYFIFALISWKYTLKHYFAQVAEFVDQLIYTGIKNRHGNIFWTLTGTYEIRFTVFTA